MRALILLIWTGCGAPPPDVTPTPAPTSPSAPAPTTPPEPPRCGDGTVDPGEACDEGDVNGTDGASCFADCLAVAVEHAPHTRPLDPVDGSLLGARDLQVGDLDGDGTPDLWLSALGDQGSIATVQALNDGAGKLWTPRLGRVRGGATDLALSDLTGDGRVDAVGVSGAAIARQEMWASDPEGLAPAQPWTIDAGYQGGTAEEIEIVELSGDAFVDAIVLASTPQQLVLMAGTAAGPMTPVREVPLPATTHSDYAGLQHADVTGDGILDVVVFSLPDSIAAVCPGARAVSPDLDVLEPCVEVDGAGVAGSSVGAIDLDGDGDDEIVGIGSLKDGLSIFDGDDKLVLVDSLSLEDGAETCEGLELPPPAIADLDGDGRDEIVIPCDNGPFQVEWSAGGAARVRHLTCRDCAERHRAVRFADADGDGRLDLLGLARTGELAVWWGDASGRLPAEPDVYGVGDGTTFRLEDLRVADLTGDGAPDLVLRSDVHVALVQGLPGRRFLAPGRPLEVYIDELRTVAVDLDGDGIVGLAAIVPDVDDAHLALIGPGPGGLDGRFVLLEHEFPEVWGPEDGHSDLTAGRVDGDQAEDIVLVSDVDDEYHVLLSDGAGQAFRDVVSLPTVSPGVSRVWLVDLDGDDLSDLVGLDPVAGQLEIRRGNGDATFGIPGFVDVGPVAGVLLADVDGDGLGDLVTAREATGEVAVHRSAGALAWAAPVLVGGGASLGEVTGLTAGDPSDDGIVDLVATTDDDRLWLYLGFGDGAWSRPIEQRIGDGPSSVALTDLDGDGVDDVVIVHRSAAELTVLASGG